MEYDQETLKNYQDDVDNLLVFAGLFSAVLTAFLIESYPRLLRDTSGGNLPGQGQQTGQFMASNISQGLYSTAASPSPSASFQPSTLDIRINVLWFASLLLSLMAASFGILVKQWLREYMAFKDPSPKARLRTVRRMRYPALTTWRVFTIASLLPMLVHLSLALFFIGLVSFAKSVHRSIEYTTLPLVSVWGVCFAGFAISPLFFPHCPYHTTLLKKLYAWVHQVVEPLASNCAAKLRTLQKKQRHLPYTREAPAHRRQRTPLMRIIWWKICVWWTSWKQTFVFWGGKLGARWAQRPSLLDLWLAFFETVAHSCKQVDETKVALIENQDFSVLSAADATQISDELLETEVFEAARQIDLGEVHPHSSPKFIYELLRNRLSTSEINDHHWIAIFLDLRKTSLSERTQKAIMRMIEEFLSSLGPSYRLPLEFNTAEVCLPRDIKVTLSPQLIFTLLRCLSGCPVEPNNPLIEYLQHTNRGADIRVLCRNVIAPFFPYKSKGDSNSSCMSSRHIDLPNTISINVLHGVSLLYMQVNAQWSLSQALNGHVPDNAIPADTSVTAASAGPPTVPTVPDAPTTPTAPGAPTAPTDPSNRMTYEASHLSNSGARAMLHMLTLGLRTCESNQIVVRDVLKSLCKEVKRNQPSSESALRIGRRGPPKPADDSTADSVALQVRVDSLATYICFQLCHPQWFQLETLWAQLQVLRSLPETPGDISLSLAIYSIPTLGMLRLCYRTLNHSCSFNAMTMIVMQQATVKRWGSSLEHCLRNDSIQPNVMYVLKLLSFSVYLYTFSTPRRWSTNENEKAAWRKIFDQLAEGIESTFAKERMNLEDLLCNSKAPAHSHQTPWFLLATICLELIRFEEILARIWEEDKPQASNTNGDQPLDSDEDGYQKYMANREMKKSLVNSGWRSVPFHSVFSQTLVDRLEVIVRGPSWSTRFKLSEAYEEDIKFHDYCLQYEKHVGGLLKLRDKDDVWTWLRGYCSQSPKASGLKKKPWRWSCRDSDLA